MAHVRAQIRDAVATALASVGPTVKKSRAYPVKDYPALFVYTNSEQIVQRSSTITLRDLTVLIECLVQDQADAADDTMDGYAVSIEQALAFSTLGGLAKDVYLSSTDSDFASDGDAPVGMIRLTYSVTYAVSDDDPETAK